MLTIVYKIIAKVIASRLTHVLSKVISPHQHVFFKGRSIEYHGRSSKLVPYLLEAEHGLITVVVLILLGLFVIKVALGINFPFDTLQDTLVLARM